MATESFEQFIHRWIGQYGTAQKLADAIGMSLSAFSRGVRNSGTLGVESLLRLALATGEPPSTVLRIAGKRDVADLVEHLYGTARSSTRGLSGQEQELISLWNGLSRDAQEPLLLIIGALASNASSRGLEKKTHTRRSA
jgi:transcriptional regulator with XRE-family HTH domain